MKVTRILLGGIAGGLTFFFLGWLLYGILIYDFMEANSNLCANRPDGIMLQWALILSNLAIGFLISVIFYLTKSKSILKGLQIGAITGCLLSIFIDFSFYSMTTVYTNLATIFVDILVFTFNSSVAGIFIGWIFTFRSEKQ